MEELISDESEQEPDSTRLPDANNEPRRIGHLSAESKFEYASTTVNSGY